MIELQLLLLLIVANGAPILVQRIMGKRWAAPLDRGIRLVDGQPLLGRSKTLRGVVAAVLLTGATAPLLGYTVTLGALVAALSMLGDLLSSFVKRRMKRTESSMALVLDQVPESLLPLLLLRGSLDISWLAVARIVLLFFVLELLLSRLLYRVGIRQAPY